MNIILPILIISILVISCDQNKSAKTTYKVEPINMQGLRTRKDSVQSLKVSRKSIDDSTVVLFPSGGTVTDIVLHRQSEYENWKSGQTGERPEILRSDQETVNDSIEDGLRIDLTRLPDGNYIGEWFTCDIGGYTVIELKTEKYNN